MTAVGRDVAIPKALLARSGDASRAHWLDALPRLVDDVLTAWSLKPDGPPRSGQTAMVIPVLTAAGRQAALKLGWPHPEAQHEHLALRAWDGRGAVRLLRADPRRSVLLLERADADVDLTSLPVVEACEVAAGLYGQLHRPAIPQLERLSARAGRWADELGQLRAHGAVPRRYVDQAAGLARDFAADPGSDGRLLHGDLHYLNVLAGDRGPWLAIDPKPVSGEAAFEVAPLLWNRWDEAVVSGNIRNAVLDRMYAVVDAAMLDEDRVRAWVVVRELVNVAWALTDLAAAVDPDFVTTAITIVKAVQR